jgi:hypothetical protein
MFILKIQHRLWLFLSFIFLNNLSITAQDYRKTSGYIGKKNILSAKANLYPSFKPQSSGGNAPAMSLNKEYQLEFTRVVKSYFGVTVCAGQSMTSEIIRRSGEAGDIVYHQSPEGYQEELRSVEGRPSIEDKYYGVKFKFYLRSKGALAPLGLYSSLGCNVHNYTIDYTDVRLTMLTNNPFTGEEFRTYKLSSPIHTYQIPEINLAMGLNRAIGKHFVTDIGAQLGALLFEKKAIPRQGTVGLDPTAIHLENTTIGRARGFNICKIYFALGFIF